LHIFARWASTLKFRIVAMATVTSLLAAAGTAALVLASARQSMVDVMLADARDDREGTAGLLTGKVDMLTSALSAVAGKVPAAGWGDDALMTAYLVDKAAIHTIFESVFIAGRDGQIVVRTKDGRASDDRPNVADREYFQRAIASDQPVVSRALMGRATKAPLVIFAVPIVGADGQAIGVVGGSVPLRSSALFADIRAASARQSVDVVVDRSGTVLSHPEATRILGPAADVAGLQRAVETWVANGSPIDHRAEAALDGEYLVSSAGIPLTDWMLLRVTPAAVAFQPVDAATRTAWMAALAAAAAAAALAGGLAYALTRPITRLHTRAVSLLDPKRAHEVWPAEQGEIGELSRVFEGVVRERAQRQNEVQALVTQLEAILDHADVGIALTRNGRFELVSRQFCHIFRCSKADAEGQPTRMVYPTDAAYEALSARARPAFMENGSFDGELEMMRHSGQQFWARMRGRAVTPGDLSHGTIWTFEDVTASREQREKLTYSATHDELTGLANRSAFELALEQAMATPEARPLSVLFIDLDRFKQVNDLGGHAAGDALLRDVAAALKAQVRRSDLVARLGGDEFAVLLPFCPEHHGRALAEKLCAAVAGYELNWEGQRYTVGASVGLTVVNEPVHTTAEILRAADAACYVAKRQGRSRVEQQRLSMPAELV
jgi:diguanylate cyclase